MATINPYNPDRYNPYEYELRKREQQEMTQRRMSEEYQRAFNAMAEAASPKAPEEVKPSKLLLLL